LVFASRWAMGYLSVRGHRLVDGTAHWVTTPRPRTGAVGQPPGKKHEQSQGTVIATVVTTEMAQITYKRSKHWEMLWSPNTTKSSRDVGCHHRYTNESLTLLCSVWKKD
jgi:hypothetical protein